MGITFAARMVMWGALLGGNNRDRNPIGELAFALLAPIAAMLIQAAVSRSRGVGRHRANDGIKTG